MCVEVAQSRLTLCDLTDYNSPWDSPGQNTGLGSLSLLQGIFPTQGSNPGLLLGIESRKQRAWAFPQRARCLSGCRIINMTHDHHPDLGASFPCCDFKAREVQAGCLGKILRVVLGGGALLSKISKREGGLCHL